MVQYISYIHSVHTLVSVGLTVINFSIPPECISKVTRLYFKHENAVQENISYTYCHLSRSSTKPTKWHVRPAKTQISPGIRTVWSESSLFSWRTIVLLAIHWAHNEDSDQTGRMPRLFWVFAVRTGQSVGFVMLWLIDLHHTCVDRSIWGVGKN